MCLFHAKYNVNAYWNTYASFAHTSYQYAYQPGISTTHPLRKLVNRITKSTRTSLADESILFSAARDCQFQFSAIECKDLYLLKKNNLVPQKSMYNVSGIVIFKCLQKKKSLDNHLFIIYTFTIYIQPFNNLYAHSNRI